MENAVIGPCDRCGKDILRRKGENLTVLKAVNYKMDLETYRIEYTICPECKKSFSKWITGKGDDAP